LVDKNLAFVFSGATLRNKRWIVLFRVFLPRITLLSPLNTRNNDAEFSGLINRQSQPPCEMRCTI